MGEILNAIRQFFLGLKLWVIVVPWEQTLRVRCGKWVKLLGAGIHLRIPILDQLYSQSTRMRISSLGRQTVSTKDGKTITFTASVGYSIENVELLYRTLHHAEGTVANMARSAIADYIFTHDFADCHPSVVQRHAQSELSWKQYGLGGAQVYLTDFATVRTYRVIGDFGFDSSGSSLSVEKPNSSNESGY